MNDDIFSLVRQKIRKAKTDDPREIADYYGIMWIPLKGTITGYAASYQNIAVIGINERLTGMWLRFAAWHELAHVFAGHIYEPQFRGSIVDNHYFHDEVDSLLISRHEKTANLVSADICIRDEDVYRVTNYNSSTMCTYRRTKRYREDLIRNLNALRPALCPQQDTSNASVSFPDDSDMPAPGTNISAADRRILRLEAQLANTDLVLAEMEEEISASGCCKTFRDIAHNLGINERILRYKLEAMRLRGLDMDSQELERYSKIFLGALQESSA